MKDVKDFELTFDGERCSLLIREVYLEDSGDYRCVAKNSQGTAETSCRLVVERRTLALSTRDFLCSARVLWCGVPLCCLIQ